jgi:hypothetical protein
MNAGQQQEQAGDRMNAAARAAFVASYERLVTRVWSDPDVDALLEQEPRALMARYGLVLPASVSVAVVRHAPNAPSDLGRLVAAWEDAPSSGRFALVVPPAEAEDDGELDERELDTIVAGLGPGSSFRRPCFYTS